MALASHVGGFARKTLVCEQWAYETWPKMGKSGWKHISGGPLLRMQVRVNGAGGLVGY